MSRRNRFIHDEYHDGKINHIFGIFEAIGNLGSAAINKSAQDEANESNEEIFDKQMYYTKQRDELADQRYNEETAYNRAFSDDERAYNRAFAEDERAYNRAFAEDERAYNRAFAEDERAYNRAFAEDERAYNRAYQEENRAYTRALQQEIFEREDTALERQAQSLSKMGINPLSVTMNGLGAGQALTSPSASGSSYSGSSYSGSSYSGSSYGGSSAPSAGNAHNNSQPSAPNLQAFTGWQLSGLEPSLEFMNQLDNLHTAGIQRDLLRQQENYQKLVNMAYANDNDIQLDKYGNPIGITKTVTNQEIKKAEQEGRTHNNREANARANIEERENDFQYNSGSHKSASMPAQWAWDSSWMAYNAATGIRNAYNNHVDNAKSKSDSKIATLQDRLSDAGNKLLTHTINSFMKARSSMSRFFKAQRGSIEQPSHLMTSGRNR